MKSLLTILLLSLLCVTVSFAGDSAPLIQRLDGTAWIQHESGANTAVNGQSLKPADELTILSGNKAVVQVDENDKNVVIIEGPAAVCMTADGLAHSTELKKGKIFCLVDQMQEGSAFSIMTPVAVAAVRGTQFQVATIDGKTLVFNYDGQVEVRQRRPGGSASEKFLVLNKGEKTALDGSSDEAPKPSHMTKEEFSVIEEVRDYVFGNSAEPAPTSPSTEKKTEKEKKSDPLDVQSHWE